MFEITNAGLRYGSKTILHPVTVNFRAGELTVIIGPNGAGKSSLLKLATGQVKPSSGDVLLAGIRLREQTPAALANRRAVLSQSTVLSFPFTVLEVVKLGLINEQSKIEIAVEMLKQVDLAGFEGRLFQQLSGGEQQRVHLARVLCQLETSVHDPPDQFLFLDEPTSNLDIKHQLMILDTARSYSKQGVGVVAVLHDLNMTAVYADRVIVMEKGRNVLDGQAKDVITDQCMREIFDVNLSVGRVPDANTPFVLPTNGIVGG